MIANLDEKDKLMFLAYVTWIGGGKKWNFWNWIGTTAHVWQGGAQEIIGTQESNNFRERFLSAKLTFATPSVVLIVGWECEIAMPIMLHSASITTIPNCDTVTLCYTPQSPTVTLSQARLRHVAVYGCSVQCEGSYLRVASPFQVGRSRSESK